ncbi:hypothetical protein [Altererythrobacter sp. BO-6]|uniref:hypothetical protein n=1 Tax=Altererythrobacter sp. BO-6 TaxID=2604537 RepID=UPI0019D249D4|nr:hypothetical protein [Altererythrobacter sp. BO-6]
MHDPEEPLPPEQQLALSYSPQHLRPKLAGFFALDRRLGTIVAKTTEPLLGQMRLAWWRDMLGRPVDERPKGDPVLDQIGQYWCGLEQDLLHLVDAWEVMVTQETLGSDQIEAFGNGRSTPLICLSGHPSGSDGGQVCAAAWCWALADAACGVSAPQERALLVEAGLSRSLAGGRWPRHLRGIGVLDALSRRALLRGGRPLMEGRGAALVALRAGLLGR